MRSYSQYCSLAKALDVLGERWTMLIVRELLLRGPCRYTDLREGLPGIASNLLAERLRTLEAAGVVAREQAPPPVATTLFRLTPRGEELRTVLYELARWGMPLMEGGPAHEDVFREEWAVLLAQMSLRDSQPDRPPVRIQLRAGGDPVVIETAGASVRLHRGGAGSVDVTLDGAPPLVLGVLSGRLALEQAERRGLRVEGSHKALRRLLPEPAGLA
jgi:DNA-binding HxlR family transcriptional regulator